MLGKPKKRESHADGGVYFAGISKEFEPIWNGRLKAVHRESSEGWTHEAE